MRPTGAEMEGYAGPRPSTNHGVPRQEPEVVPSREGLASAGVPPAATPPDPRLANASLGRASECDCPPWVERCVHFGGHTACFHEAPFPDLKWWVCVGTGDIANPSFAPEMTHNIRDGFAALGFTNPEVARAAFEAAAERLRAGALDSQVAP